MKVIFLDIDGVLNMYGSSCRTFMKDYGQHIEPHLVQRLNYIVEQTECKIVISSSWRSDMEDLKKQLEEQGFKYWCQVIGKTCHCKVKDESLPYPRTRDNYLYNDRGEQILDYVKRHNLHLHKWLMVDDEISDSVEYMSMDHIVQTDYNEGMLHKDAIEIISRLNN